MAHRHRKNRRTQKLERAMRADAALRVALPGVNDRVKLAITVPGWGGRRGLVVRRWEEHGATHLQVRMDKTSWTLVSVLACEVRREDVLGREMEPVDTGAIWDVSKSPYPAPDARFHG